MEKVNMYGLLANAALGKPMPQLRPDRRLQQRLLLSGNALTFMP